MNTLQISSILHKLNKKYCNVYDVGVFASDEIATKKCNGPTAVICNFDKSYETGSHWVSIFISKKRDIYYFDSYALKPPVEGLIKFLNVNARKKIQYNTVSMQDLFSNVCGEYCILFLSVMMQNKKTMSDFQSLFKQKNKIKNDILVKKLYKQMIKTLKSQRPQSRLLDSSHNCVQCSVQKNAWKLNSKCKNVI